MNDSALKAKILVVDDQSANIEILAKALQAHYHILVADIGQTALHIANEGYSQ